MFGGRRDVRPSNIIVVDAGLTAVLVDWASARAVGRSPVPYSGTLHYAAAGCLAELQSGQQLSTPLPENDLESLVYSMFDLQSAQRPGACAFSSLADISREWEAIELKMNIVKDLLKLARSLDYNALLKAEIWLMYTCGCLLTTWNTGVGGCLCPRHSVSSGRSGAF